MSIATIKHTGRTGAYVVSITNLVGAATSFGGTLNFLCSCLQQLGYKPNGNNIFEWHKRKMTCDIIEME
jgi:hypothetical protein